MNIALVLLAIAAAVALLHLLWAQSFGHRAPV